MIISHNLQAMNTNRIVNANINAHAKSTRKISSGYNINVAVDNPVGLAMSETMRKQIRGLMQGINNTKEGRSFVQVADGAMDEIHTMLQRMNELSIKAVDGLCTPEDRAALNAELDQLRTEIDRINDTTTFNTLPVFEKHEASYYQIAGNRQWNDNQLHTITSSTNELNIHLPDSYDPKDYTLTVPSGTYTTQELIDEIDNALSKMDPPNPGFVFEYTRDGYCNLNFENAQGQPTKIASVDGSLAYLIYDFKTGGSPASLLGTSPFELDQYGNPRKLEIEKGQNDELGFYAESAEGVKYVSITIPDKYYTRDEMIDEINRQLSGIDDAKGITAKPYGDTFIQITGGDTVNITGLKGNMFKFEPEPLTHTSVFYDNAVYGSCTKDNAYVTGWNHAYKIKIYKDTANKNDTLYFKLNDNDVRTIKIPDGEYTVSGLVDTINKLIEDEGLSDEIEAVYTGTRLNLSSKIEGDHSRLNFSIGSDVDPADAAVYNKTYETLFLSTSGNPYVTYNQPASITGLPSLNGKIELTPEATLSFNIQYKDGSSKNYTIGKEFIGGEHTDLTSLINKLNDYVKNNPEINGTIEFASSSDDKITINSSADNIKNISFPAAPSSDGTIYRNETYYKLFTIVQSSSTGSVSIGKTDGSKKEQQGHPGFYDVIPASIGAGSCKLPVTIDENNGQISLQLTCRDLKTNAFIHQETIAFNLDPGSYNDIGTLREEINKKLREKGTAYTNCINVTYSGNELRFTFTPPENETIPNGKWGISLSRTSAWNAILGTTETLRHPSSQPARDYQLNSYHQITNSIELSDQSGNNTLWFSIDGNPNPYKLTINGNCNSREDIFNALQNAIDNSPLKDIVEAHLNSGYLSLSATGARVLSSNPKTGEESTFYKEVLCKGVYTIPYSQNQKGTCDFNSSCIIGRKDLTTESIQIMEGFNDTLTFDITCPNSSTPLEISITIPEKLYHNGYELVEVLNKDETVRKQITQQLGEDSDLDISFSIGGYNTEVFNSIDPLALQITVDKKPGKEPEKGEYIIDGVRGNAACFVFYKTASLPSTTYITGTKDISEGITFEPGKNVLTLSANSIPYQYTFPENKPYSAKEFVQELNRRFTEGDDNGNSAPLRATLEDGVLKIWHKTVGANTITDIGGSGRSTIFFEEEGRDSQDPLILQVGAEQRSTIELPRIRVDSSSLSINSITLSQPKYAEKAVEHIKSAIKILSAKRSNYGAMQNRLDHTINNNENVADRVQASESRIRDTDISSELIRYSNLNILLQAGHKMIAHSNNNINKLLTILQ